MRLRPSLAVTVLVLVVAGCSGAGNGTGPDVSPTATPATATQTTSATTQPETDDSLRVSPVYEYQNLSTESREDFHFVLEQGTVETESKLFGPRIAAENFNVIRVRYDGRVVRIRHQYQQRESKTCLQNVSEVPESSVDADDTTAYENLSSEGRETFLAVLSGNASSVCYDPGAYPIFDSYVEYGGEYYALSELHGSTAVYYYHVRTNASASNRH